MSKGAQKRGRGRPPSGKYPIEPLPGTAEAVARALFRGDRKRKQRDDSDSAEPARV